MKDHGPLSPGRQSRRDEIRRHLRFIGLAALVHLAAIPWMGPLIPDAPEAKGSKMRVVTLMSGKSTGKRANQRERPKVAKKERKKPPKKRAEATEKPVGQVVRLPPSARDEVPEDAQFSSEHNTKVERQSVSRNRSAEFEVALNEVSRAQNKASSPTPGQERISMNLGSPTETPPSPTQKKNLAAEERLALPRLEQSDRLRLALDPNGILKNQSLREALFGQGNRLNLSLGQEDRESQEAGTPAVGNSQVQLVPDVGVLSRLSGGPANDHIEDVEEGEGTFLNSREFKYASFFNRIARGLNQHWNPTRELRRRDPTGQIYGSKTRATFLSVTLNADGSLKDLDVVRSSGLEFLDREAMAAFRRAEPFPNPPSGLLAGGGQSIEFKYGFYLEFRGGGIRLPF